jgi:hypothetical protein
LYYAAVQYGLVLLAKWKLEKIAGSFDEPLNDVDTRKMMVGVRV